MKIEVLRTNIQAGNTRAAITCPHCRNQAVFEHWPNNPDYNVNASNQVVGSRKCPNPQCNGHVFVVMHGMEVIKSYPPSRIDFITDGVPPGIVTTLEEAITCESQECYVAAAIMVRRTLEEVCADQKATGHNLKARIEDLSTKIVVPQELKDAMDELRLLGNDAAHIEATEFDEVSEEEVAVAIEFAKEMLKAIYQYKSLLGRMRALKKKPAP